MPKASSDDEPSDVAPRSLDQEPTSNARLSEQVYESLVEMIVRGKIKPAQAISEVELARILGVSRTPVHEAVKQLVKDGLIVQAANRRPVVVSFGPDDVNDVYEMRRILESEAAAKAAERMDRQTLTKLEGSLQRFRSSEKSAETITNWVAIDDEFHTAIAKATGSLRLSADIDRYRLLHRVFNRTHTDANVLEQAAEEHQQILNALKRRDADEARQAMRHHLEEWQRFFANHLR